MINLESFFYIFISAVEASSTHWNTFFDSFKSKRKKYTWQCIILSCVFFHNNMSDEAWSLVVSKHFKSQVSILIAGVHVAILHKLLFYVKIFLRTGVTGLLKRQ
jgi:hypothetical protein